MQLLLLQDFPNRVGFPYLGSKVNGVYGEDWGTLIIYR